MSLYTAEFSITHFFNVFLIVPRRSLKNSTIKVFMLLACHG